MMSFPLSHMNLPSLWIWNIEDSNVWKWRFEIPIIMFKDVNFSDVWKYLYYLNIKIRLERS